jgi:hypothetical protein
MPEFIPILIVAVLSLVVLLLVYGEGIVPSYTRTIPSSSRTIVLGRDFSVSYVSGEEFVTHMSGEVSQGVFSGEKKRVEFDIDNPGDISEGVIKLKVWNSNYYGGMIIKINGEEIYKGYPEIGERTIVFNGNILKYNNVLEVVAESSGWRIWAPTVYIFDLNLSVNYPDRRKQSFTFELSDLEIMNTNRARLLVFGKRYGTGSLIVRLNGFEVFRGFTNVYTDFSTDILREGNNTLELSTEPNTTYEISSAEVVLFFG